MLMRRRRPAMAPSNYLRAICGSFLAFWLMNVVMVLANQNGAQGQQASHLVLPWPFSNVWPLTPPQQQDTGAAAATAVATAAVATAAAAAAVPATAATVPAQQQDTGAAAAAAVPSTAATSKNLSSALPGKLRPLASPRMTGSNANGMPLETKSSAAPPTTTTTTTSGTKATAAARPPAAANTAVPAAPKAAPAHGDRKNSKKATAVKEPQYDLSQVLPPIILRPGPATATTELKLGCLLPLGGGSTPEDKSVGEAVLAAAKMAINDELPRLLPGSYVNLTCYNTQCTGLAAAAGVYYLADHNIDAAIGDVCSTSSLAAAAAAKIKRVLIVSPAATSPSLSMKDTFYRTVPSDVFQAFAASQLMFQDFGATRVGLVFESNTYGHGLVDNLAAADDNSTEIIYEFAPGRGDAQQAVAAAVVARDNIQRPINALFLAMNDVAFAAEFLKQAAAQKLDLPLFGGDTLTSPSLLDMVAGSPSAIANLTCMSVNPGRAAFIERFAKAAPGVKFEPYAAPAYDATVAVLKAYQATGIAADGAQLAKRMSTVLYEGVSGPVQFDMFGDVVVHAESYVYGQFNLTMNKFVLTGFAS